MIAKAEQKIGETQLQLINVHDEYQKEVLTELRDTQGRLADVLEQFKIAEDVLARTILYAPRDGVVVGLQKHTRGGVITPGQEVLEIVPSQDAFVIEAHIDPMDIDVVVLGLKAKVKLTALKQRSTPTIDGIVDHVSADTFVDETTGLSYYKANIKLPEDALQQLGPVTLYPGMPVQVMIITAKQTPFSYFITPIKDSFQRAFRES
ncbi:MAG: HlyD family type I secretion periplasmic adaptor subunit [Gammaproteobacteria bacterium]